MSVKIPQKPELLLPPGVTRLEPKPIKEDEGKAWQSSLDCLKELIKDIEHERISEPDMIFICLRTKHKEKQAFAYPAYGWSKVNDGDTWLKMMGLLQHHLIDLNIRGR
jgi:hypothetical protein